MLRIWPLIAVGVSLVVGAVAAALVMGSQFLAPVRASVLFPYGLLAEEAEVMNDCVECHEPVDFHTCGTCHDDHGSAEMANVPFNDLILLAGDARFQANHGPNSLWRGRIEPLGQISSDVDRAAVVRNDPIASGDRRRSARLVH